jgi:Alpha/beta hydrolase domain
VIHTDTETEVALFLQLYGELPYRRPDSDARNDRYRLWEVPGASHADADANGLTAAFEATGKTTLVTGCAHQGAAGVVDPNDFPFKYVVNGAFAALTAWVTGVPPPRANRIQVTSTSPRTIVRDDFGNALGGLRTPFVDVPITTYFPTDTGPGFCILFGYNIPFGHDELGMLYENHGDYVSQVLNDTNELVGQHFWLSADGQTVKSNAEVSNVP